MQLLRATLVALACVSTFAQSAESPKQRIRAIKDLSKLGSEAISRIEPYLHDSDIGVRVEAVRAIGDIGTMRSLDPLTASLSDVDSEVQIRATDALVNFYLPGYIKTGISGSLKRAGSAIKGKFTDTNDQVIDPYMQARPDVIAALGNLVTNSAASADARANAARALGVLRGRSALEQVLTAVRSKDDQVIYESLVAVRKIRDPQAAPRIAFRLRDLDDRVQIAAIETTGLLLNKSAAPDLRDVFEHARNIKVKRAALTALAMLPDPKNRAIYQQYLNDKDDGLRGAAAEGFARLKEPADQPMLEKAFESETKMNPRLSYAFAAVAAGRNDASEFSPLRYLTNALNSKAYHDVAGPFLVELARDPGVRRTLYGVLKSGTKEEKIYLAQVFAESGDKETVPYLETLAADLDNDVAQEGRRALRTLKSKL